MLINKKYILKTHWIRMLCGQPVFLIFKSRKSQIRCNSVLSSDYYRYEIFDFQTMINPIFDIAIQKSELWNLKSEFGNQKSETRNQNSEIANRNSWKPEIHNWEIRNQKLDFRNATCNIQFWQPRFIPACDVNISNIESVKSSLRGWVKRF